MAGYTVAVIDKEAMELGAGNFSKIDRSAFVFAVLDGTDVDSGTSAEIGYACARGKKVVGYRGDFRMSADAGACTVNLQVEAAIELAGGHAHQDMDNAVSELVVLASGP